MGEDDNVINIDIKSDLPAKGTTCIGHFYKKLMTVLSLICDNFGTGRGLKAKMLSHDITISTFH